MKILEYTGLDVSRCKSRYEKPTALRQVPKLQSYLKAREQHARQNNATKTGKK
jgi:hypothetical protein